MYRRGEAVFHDYRDCQDLDLEVCDDILVGDIVLLKSFIPYFPRYGINMCILGRDGEKELDTNRGLPPRLSREALTKLESNGVRYTVAARKLYEIYPESARKYLSLARKK